LAHYASSHEIGQYSFGRPGPTLILIGGIHGNEPAGVQAIKQVLKLLRAHNSDLCGRLVGFAGNLPALRADRRYIDIDFNRVWDDPDQKLVNAPHERVAYSSLSRQLKPYLNRRDTIVFDLHTTSAKGAPFLLVGSQEFYRPFSGRFPVPVVSGLIDELPGTLVSVFQKKGILAFAAEGGEHGDPQSVRNLVSLIYCAMKFMLCFQNNDHIQAAESYLEEKWKHLPSFLEMTYHHHIHPNDHFKMMPGYSNFMPVYTGEILAHNKRGPIPAPVSGRMLMPLYHGQGEDGFFLIRE
jgi:succinylglutamate desuccinylase